MTATLTTFTNEGLTFDVTDSGPREGDPVVLLHGFPERATCWRFVAPLLHEAGLRTIAPDQRGYSPGARPSGRYPYRTSALADDVIALLGTIGRPVHLVGHDWGSAVGWTVAARRPDLVRTLTAFSVPHPTAYIRALLGPQGPKSWYMAYFNLPWLPENWLGMLDRLLSSSGMTGTDLRRFRSEIVDYGALPGALGWYRAMPLSKPVGRISVPTTMVWSDGDSAVARAGVDATARWVTGPYEKVVLRGVNHWIPTQAPDAAASAVLARARSG
ncbi:Pimeloyl-ACP methyl ester carboxylesterase [Actinopolyspora lacussalsi subsp. righensis]|uniref:Pimeloyl-ACP methyl ester carboxylesterase n=1 Tax=Actinopolyspora righensis TaxID=995060 RepID=A0A1I7CB96_9ACTN|nr:alpha/beta fold hydrolase [Actinopolyspora righensis]SFT96690.1 Pimeloyl-ACP methyl ester carboxylesterase [Actinopolyspora righensis]